MIIGPNGAETKNDCTGEGQKQFTRLICNTSACQDDLCRMGFAQRRYLYVPPVLTFTRSECLSTWCISEFLMIPTLLTDYFPT
jgi:hypothetical protein